MARYHLSESIYIHRHVIVRNKMMSHKLYFYIFCMLQKNNLQVESAWSLYSDIK